MTHFAIDFNDFSSLLSASLRDKSPGAAGPLQFVGFEMSEFCVTKCRVVAHMLGSLNVAITSVMEVWLSSTRSETTPRDFRKSVNMVLVSLYGQYENAKVLSYLLTGHQLRRSRLRRRGASSSRTSNGTTRSSWYRFAASAARWIVWISPNTCSPARSEGSPAPWKLY
jgi:hypothetical protein